MTSRDGLPYRPCVGVMLVNAQGKVWMGRRNDQALGSDAWQMPQGGVDAGEDPRPAALRELEEEAGLAADKVEVLGETDGWLRYTFPEWLELKWRKNWAGQEQKWFLALLRGTDADIDVAGVAHPEFDAWKWVDLDEVCPMIVAFKRPVYEQVVAAFTARIAAIAAPPV
jgi:putative (di)nucleoside polyphosphate hydrolase